MAIFLLFLCNFAVAQRLLNHGARSTGNKQKGNRNIYAEHS